jgi:hypothetical protein
MPTINPLRSQRLIDRLQPMISDLSLPKHPSIVPSQIQKFFISHLKLIILGVVIECFYLFYLLHSFPLLPRYQSLTDMGLISNYSHASFITFLLVFSLLFVLLILAQRHTNRYQDKATLYLVIGFGVLFSSTALFVYPINAIDIFGYIAESRVLILYHANPMTIAPAHYTQDAFIQSLGRFVALPTPYGSLGVLIESIPTIFAGSHLLVNVLLVKGLSALFLLGSSYLIYRIVIQFKPEMALSCALVFAWNPYTQLEYVVNGHNDIIMIFFMLLAILASVNNRHGAAFVLMLLSALVKYAVLPIIPILIFYTIFNINDLTARLKYILFVCLATLIILAVFIFPFWRGVQTFASIFTTAQGSLYSFSMFLNDFSSLRIATSQSKIIGLVIFGSVYLIALLFVSRNWISLLMGCFLTLFAFLAFAVTYVQPWYIIWISTLALLLPHKYMQRLALVLAYGATMIELVHPYIWSWGVFRNPSGYAITNSMAYLILFAPSLCLFTGYVINVFSTRFRLHVEKLVK